jgi:hypothetical protein
VEPFQRGDLYLDDDIPQAQLGLLLPSCPEPSMAAGHGVHDDELSNHPQCGTLLRRHLLLRKPKALCPEQDDGQLFGSQMVNLPFLVLAIFNVTFNITIMLLPMPSVLRARAMTTRAKMSIIGILVLAMR